MVKKSLLSVVLIIAATMIVSLSGCNKTPGASGTNDTEESAVNTANEGGFATVGVGAGEYTVEFTREAYDGENVSSINQYEVKVAHKDNGRLNDYALFIYDENGDLASWVTTVYGGEALGNTSRITNADYDAMAKWEIYNMDQVDAMGNITGEPLIAGTK